MKFRIAASLAVLLAACSPQAPAPAPSASIAATASPTQAAAKRLPLPDCAALASQDDPAYKDCRLVDAKSGFAFEARFSPNTTPGEPEHIVNVAVVKPGDATLQTITEKVEGTITSMELEDLDGEGARELLVSLSTGNVNTDYAVWHMPAGATQFIRVGEISGFAVGQKDGFVTVNSRSAANIQNLDYYTLKNGQLKHIAQAEFTAEGDPAKFTVKCAIIDGKADDPKGGLAAASLTPAAAKAKWCSEDAKKAAFQ